MKVLYFMLTAIGIMFFLNIAGIDTGSSKIIDFIGAGDLSNTTSIDISKPSGSNYVPQDIESQSTFWSAIWVAIIIFTIGSTIAIILGGSRQDSIVDTILGALASVTFGIFGTDMYSIVNYMAEITGGVGYIFWSVKIIMVLFLVGYGISLISFIRGTDG